MMGGPYLEVVRTYVDRRLLVLVAAILALFLVVPAMSGNPHSPWPTVPFVIAFMLFEIVTYDHLMEQLAYAQSSLIPRFVRPHLVVAGLVIVSTCMLSAAVWASVSSASLLGATAVTFTAFTLWAWGFGDSSCCRWVLFLGLGAFCSEWFRNTAGAAISNPTSALSVALLAASLGGLSLLAHRLAHIHRETYQSDGLPTEASPAPSSKEETVDEHDGEWSIRFPQAWIDRHLDAVLAAPSTGLWHEARRIRAAIGGQPLWFVTLAALCAASAILVFISLPERSNNHKGVRSVDLLLAFTYAVAVSTHDLRIKWGHVISEGLLQPVTRKTLFQCIALAIGLETLGLWFGLSGGLIVSWLFLAPRVLQDPTTWCMLIALGGFLALSGGGSAFLMGRRHNISRVFASLLWCLVVWISWGVASAKLVTAAEYLWYGAMAMLLGIALMACGYRLWLRVDWD